MKNTEIRRVLEKEILRFKALQKPIKQSEFDEYYSCLEELEQLDKISALNQKKIYTYTYGRLNSFVSEFLDNISPLINKKGKKICFNNFLGSDTPLSFSPRLTEIALGCMLSEFLSQTNHICLSCFGTDSGNIISINGAYFHSDKLNMTCINHIAWLHKGRTITTYFRNSRQISLFFPFSSQLQPHKEVPCSPELCRLCHL